MKLKFGTNENQFNRWLTKEIIKITGGFAKKVGGGVTNSGHLDHYGMVLGVPFFLEQKFVSIGRSIKPTTPLIGGPKRSGGTAKTWSPNQVQFIKDASAAGYHFEGEMPIIGGLVGVHHEDWDIVLGFSGEFIRATTLKSGKPLTAADILPLGPHEEDEEDHPFIWMTDQGNLNNTYCELEELLEAMKGDF